MVKTEMLCPDCQGRITAVRDLEDALGLAEIEAHHFPTCKALVAHDGSGDTQQHEGEAQAVHVASDAPQSHRVGGLSILGRLPGDPAGAASRARQRGLRNLGGAGE